MAEKINVCRENRVSATFLNLAVPKLHPPMARNTLSFGFFAFNPMTLWYKPAFPSLDSSLFSNEESLPS